MKVIVADSAGFCWGVERAVRMAIEATETGKRVYLLGEVIHNSEVIRDLERRGAVLVSSPDQVDDRGGLLVIRAHGVSKKVKERARELGITVVDGTCPFVERVQQLAEGFESSGRVPIIVGKAGHPEVQGVLGHTRSGVVVEKVEDVEMLPEIGKVGVVSQTTWDREEFRRICRRIEERFEDVVVKDTICPTTRARIDGARRLAAEVDLMIVIGDRNSSNTTHLAEECSRITRTYLVGKADEIDPSWLHGVKSVGITGGASTPRWMIEEAARKLERI
jgi:4-hydroxy-3-methylbut-2-enyl diphosphate reductase